MARRGTIDLPIGSRVQVHFHLNDFDPWFYRSAEVRWIRFAGFNSYLGLRFEQPLEPSDPISRAFGVIFERAIA